MATLLENSEHVAMLNSMIVDYLDAAGLEQELVEIVRAALQMAYASPQAFKGEHGAPLLLKVFKAAMNLDLGISVSMLSTQSCFNSEHTFVMKPWSTIDELKCLIQEQFQIPISEQRLLKGSGEPTGDVPMSCLGSHLNLLLAPIRGAVHQGYLGVQDAVSIDTDRFFVLHTDCLDSFTSVEDACAGTNLYSRLHLKDIVTIGELIEGFNIHLPGGRKQTYRCNNNERHPWVTALKRLMQPFAADARLWRAEEDFDRPLPAAENYNPSLVRRNGAHAQIRGAVCEGYLSIPDANNRAIQRFFVLHRDRLDSYTCMEDACAGRNLYSHLFLEDIESVVELVEGFIIRLSGSSGQTCRCNNEDRQTWVAAIKRLLNGGVA